VSSTASGLRYLEQSSPIHRMDAVSKLIWLVLVAIGVLMYDSFVPGAILFAASLLLALLLARVPLRTLWQSAGLVGTIGVLLGAWHAIVDPGVALAHVGPVTITGHGVLNGLQYVFRLSVVVLATLLLTWTTDIHDLMVGLVHVGLPYRFAFALFTTLRFIPLIGNEVDAVRTAHAIRRRASRSHARTRLLLWQRYLFTVLVNGLRKAEQVSLAAECRGFGAYPDRTSMKSFSWTMSGLILVLAFLILLVGLKIADVAVWSPMILQQPLLR
jgi:energy-coupling factor transport system permease protein